LSRILLKTTPYSPFVKGDSERFPASGNDIETKGFQKSWNNFYIKI
jgi:hypothetical protein